MYWNNLEFYGPKNKSTMKMKCISIKPLQNSKNRENDHSKTILPVLTFFFSENVFK